MKDKLFMEVLTLFLFLNHPLCITSFYGLSATYKPTNLYLSEDYLLSVRFEDNILIYRNDKITLSLDFLYLKIIFGDFIITYGFGYLSGYLGNSLSIKYLKTSEIGIDFYLSPSDFYSSLISKGIYLEINPFKEKILGLSFLYDDIKQNYNIISFLNFNKFSFLTILSFYNIANIIKIDDFVFENKYQFYLGSSYIFFDFLKIGFESKYFFIKDNYYFLNSFFFLEIFNFIAIRFIHKDFNQQAQYYCSNGNFFQVSFNFKKLILGFYYKDYIYTNNDKILNFEFFLKEFEVDKKNLILSIYFLIPYKINNYNQEEPTYSISSKLLLSKDFYSILEITNDLLSLCLEKKFLENHRFIFLLFLNLDIKYSTLIALPQSSIYDSYDFYIPLNSYGLGLFYFFNLKNFKFSLKVIFSLSDNEINKFYFYNSVYLNF